METFKAKVKQWAIKRCRWEWTISLLAQQHVHKVFWHKKANVQEVMAATEASAYNEVTIDQVVEQTIHEAIAKRGRKRE